ncbi:MAG: hypothetical protein QM765_06880 [Myxococcales bacterium]
MLARHLGTLVAVAMCLGAMPSQANACKHNPLPDGIVSVDTYSKQDLKQLIEDGYTPEIPWTDAFGQFVDVNAYIPDLTVDEAYNFMENIYNLKLWTMSEYDFVPMGTYNGRNRYAAPEPLPPFGMVYITEEKHPETKTVDWWVGKSADDIWMHYYVRVLDAQKYMGKPGVILDWVNFGHANFEADPVMYAGFLGMRIAHARERDNAIAIMKWRHAGNTGEITPEIMAQLGLVNLHTSDPMSIWNMVMSGIKPTVKWEDLYGGFISSHFYVLDVPVDQAWAYLKNVRNMDRWTVSTRGVMPFGDDFLALETLSPVGLLSADTDLDEESRTLDIRMTNSRYIHEFGHTKFMTSSIRVMDGMDTVGKPGSVVVWTTFRHKAYETNAELAEQWKYLPVRNKYSAANVKLLLADE